LFNRGRLGAKCSRKPREHSTIHSPCRSLFVHLAPGRVNFPVSIKLHIRKSCNEARSLVWI
jgi:hypothetical protein